MLSFEHEWGMVGQLLTEVTSWRKCNVCLEPHPPKNLGPPQSFKHRISLYHPQTD